MDRTPPADGPEPLDDPSDAAPPWQAPPLVVPADGRIRREALDPDAVFVVKHLQRSGHEAYLVGGCVRDLLLGLEPKDFDVATDAPPSRIKRLFRSAFVIGRRFRLVHVRFPGNRVVETATFRADPGTLGRDPDRTDGPIHDDNVFGSAAEDAWRRDFSVNALFYDPVADTVVDHCGGLADLGTRTIRSLGPPALRIKEDPVRMIRAVHFAARLGGTLEPSLATAITACATEIEKASRSRLYIELVKVLGRGCARPTLKELYERRVLDGWLPEIVRFLDQPIAWPSRSGGSHAQAREGEPADTPPSHHTWNLLGAADAWGMNAHGVPESLMLATLLGPWLLDTYAHGPRRGPDVWSHVEETFRPLALRMNVPRKTSWELREILGMQAKLAQPGDQPRRLRTIVHRPIFPEALVYLELDLRARDHDLAIVDRWREIADEVWASSARPPRPAPDEDDVGPPADFGADDAAPAAGGDRRAGPPPGDDFGPPPLDGRPDDGPLEAPFEAPLDDRMADGPRRRRHRGGRGGRGRRGERGAEDAGRADAGAPPSRAQDVPGGFDAFVDGPTEPGAFVARPAPQPRAPQPSRPAPERRPPPAAAAHQPPPPPPPRADAPRPAPAPSLPTAPARPAKPHPSQDERPFGAGL